MNRIGLLLIFVCLQALPVLAEPIYVVSVASIKDNKRHEYEEVFKTIAPVRKAHNIKIVLHAHVVDSITAGNIRDAPNEIIILRAPDLASFKALSAEPAYQDLQQLRLETVVQYSEFSGTAIETNALKYLKNVPMAAIVLRTNQARASGSGLTLSVRLVLSTKKQASNFLNSIRSIQIHAVSFDDNPMGYMPNNTHSGSALGLIGELEKQ